MKTARKRVTLKEHRALVDLYNQRNDQHNDLRAEFRTLQIAHNTLHATYEENVQKLSSLMEENRNLMENARVLAEAERAWWNSLLPDSPNSPKWLLLLLIPATVLWIALS